MLASLHQPQSGMSTSSGPEQPEIRSQNGTIVFQSESQVDGIPQRQLVLQRKIQCVKKKRMRVIEPWCAFGHQCESLSRLLGRNLPAPVTLRQHTCEFRQKNVGSNERYVS